MKNMIKRFFSILMFFFFSIVNIHTIESFSAVIQSFSKLSELSKNIDNLGYTIDDGQSIFGFYIEPNSHKTIKYSFVKETEYLILSVSNNIITEHTLSIRDNTNTAIEEKKTKSPLIFFKSKGNNEIISIENSSSNSGIITLLVFKKNKTKIDIPVGDILNAGQLIYNYKYSENIFLSNKEDFFLIGGNLYTSQSQSIKLANSTTSSPLYLALSKGDTISTLGLKFKKGNTVIKKQKSGSIIFYKSDLIKKNNYTIEYSNQSPDSFWSGVVLLAIFETR